MGAGSSIGCTPLSCCRSSVGGKVRLDGTIVFEYLLPQAEVRRQSDKEKQWEKKHRSSDQEREDGPLVKQELDPFEFGSKIYACGIDLHSRVFQADSS